MSTKNRSESGASGLRAMVAASLLASGLAEAAATRLAVTAGAKDLMAGEAQGTAISAEGRLSLGAPASPRAWPEDAADGVVFAAAADAGGRIFVATGGGLGRLFVSTPDGRIALVFLAPEPNVTAVAVSSDGTVFCATSPDGKVYRVDPRATDPAKAGTEVGDPKEPAIWSLATGPGGAVYAGTGNSGRIYRTRPAASSGTGMELVGEVQDTHVRSLLVASDGTVWAGTSDRGLLVAISGGAARTVFDFGKPEVVGLAAAPDGSIYAAATTAEVPPLGSPGEIKPRPGVPTAQPSRPAASSSEEVPKGSVSVSTGPARLSASGRDAKEGSAQVVHVQPDGFVEPAWTFPDETLYGLSLDPRSGELLIATGGRGRVYAWKDRRIRLLTTTAERQVVIALPLKDGVATVTMASAGVSRPAAGPGARPVSGTFTAAVKDAQRLSSFGRLRFEGNVPAGAAVAFGVRAGNAEKPDATWTSWTTLLPDGSLPASAKLPQARFFQWRAELKPSPKGESPVLERVDFSYTERNSRPVIEGPTVLEPGAVYSRPGGSPTNVLTVTNPDDQGIYSGLEPEPSPDLPGKKLYRKGFRTITWKGTDPNGDLLRFEVEGTREGSGVWFPIRREVEESYLSFDATALPDGRYRFRVSGSDRLSNPEGQALGASEETGVAVIDSTAPALKVESRRAAGDQLELRVSATDVLSPLLKAEGSVNADRWRMIPAEDGSTDGTSETFVLRAPRPQKPSFLSVRVVDAAGNVAAVSAEWPKDFAEGR